MPGTSSGDGPSDDNNQVERYENVPIVDTALECLRALYPENPGVDFRSNEQREVVVRSLARCANFVGILPTGGGKSLAFLAPAILEPFMTVVMVPHKSLLNELMKKAKTIKGLKVAHWTAQNRDVGNATLIFVALESIVSYAFQM
jgi:superfamily II DNA helicase RecQ